jgi:ribonuclease P protein component
MLDRLRGRKRNERVLKKGLYWNGQHSKASFLFESPSYAPSTDVSMIFLGCKTSAKLAKRAVDRNRMRRRIKEAMRHSVPLQTKIQTVQLLITPKYSSLNAPFAELLADANTLLTTITTRYERIQNT